MENSKIAQLIKTLSDEVKTQYIDEWFELSNGSVDKNYLSMFYDSVQEKYMECVIKGEDIILREYAEQSFEDFKENYDDFEAIDDKLYFYSNKNKITREIDKFYNYFPNELVSFLFEKYISYEDLDNTNFQIILYVLFYPFHKLYR